MNELHKILNDEMTNIIDRITTQRIIKFKQIHLYDEHPRKRQLDKLRRMKNGRHFNKRTRNKLKNFFEDNEVWGYE